MLQLYYYRDPEGNFGDDLNIWLWSRLLPETVDVAVPCPTDGSIAPERPLFVGIGSILDSGIPSNPRKVVFSAGTHGSAPTIDDHWDILCVRGPRTAEALDIPQSRALTDGALLVRTLIDTSVEKKYPVAYMPHHVSTKMVDWERLANRAGFTYIAPTFEVDRILRMINATKLLITEAMHGAIVADALRVPWIPVQMHGHINDFKWADWCASVGLSYSPHRLTYHLGKPNGGLSYVKEKVKQTIAVNFLRSLPKREAFLSDRRRLDTLTEDLVACLQRVRGHPYVDCSF
jgi:succinoglycan biosynthesis protein ExoV